MTLEAYRDEIRLKLTGGVLDLEIDDATLDRIIASAFREIQRYIDSTVLITIPYKPCLDLTQYKVSSVSRVFRAEGYTVASSDSENPDQWTDPMYMAAWQMMSGSGSLYNINDWTYNYAAWNTALQNRNTLSTDLQFRFDKHTGKLYINCAFDRPSNITIEYVKQYDDVAEMKSDFWIDMLVNLSAALAKTILGRIRSRFTQSNALWTQDGERLLEEGNTELTELREKMRVASQLCYPID